jgi:hypothetical protein
MAEPLIEAASPEPTAVPPVDSKIAVHQPAAREATLPEAAAEDHIPEPEPALGDTPLSAIERLAAPVDLSPQLRRRDRLLTVAWAASFALLAALGVAGYTQRDQLMREWPASKRVYATLGLLPADAKGQTAKGVETPPAR